MLLVLEVVVIRAPLQGRMLHCKGWCGLGLCSYAAAAYRRPDERKEDPAADEEIRSCLSDPQGKSIPSDAESDSDEQHGRKPCEAGV